MRAIFVSMNLLEEKIKQIAEKEAENKNLFLVDFVIRGSSNAKIVEIFIDGEKNISAEDCADLSRRLNYRLDQLPDSNKILRLDVSSPGVDRPLKFLKQFPKHINRKMEIEYLENNATKKITAKLTSVENENLFFSAKNSEIKINFNSIISAKVLISFS